MNKALESFGAPVSIAIRHRAMTAHALTNSEAFAATSQMVGAEIPSIELSGGWESPVNLHEFTQNHPSVIYIYPGCHSSPQDHDDIVLGDVIQHRVFRDHQRDFDARGHYVVGISSQTLQAQRQAVLSGRVCHTLLCDPELSLAEELGLPTFPFCGAAWYQRLTLVVRGARVEKVFFPIRDASRSAAQAIAWMTLQGNGIDVADDAG